MKILLKPRFFVVIHTVKTKFLGLDHAIQQAIIAKENGADGIFLIPDYEKGEEVKATTADMISYLKVLRGKLPDFLIGANFLERLSNISDDVYAVKPDLLQTDGKSLYGIDKGELLKTEFFCGVAFKYSKTEGLRGEALRDHCRAVADICDVPTTSGVKTGESADMDKIQEIRSYVPYGKRLGIASGVTIENVQEFLDAGVTDYLVATSLLAHVDDLKRDILNPLKVAELSRIIHSYR